MQRLYKDSSESMSRQTASIPDFLSSQESEIHEEVELVGSTSTSQEIIQGSQLPQSQLVKDLTEVFNIFDKNGDGKISQGELESVLRSIGENPTVMELDKMVKEVDADGDGYIDLQEFIYLNTVSLKSASGRDVNLVDSMQDAFHVFDLDKNGVITADELHRVLSGLGDENLTLAECKAMIKSVDRNGDEMVDFEEFQEMMSRGLWWALITGGYLLKKSYTNNNSLYLDTNGCGENGGFPGVDDGERGPSGQNLCGLTCMYLLAKDKLIQVMVLVGEVGANCSQIRVGQRNVLVL